MTLYIRKGALKMQSLKEFMVNPCEWRVFEEPLYSKRNTCCCAWEDSTSVKTPLWGCFSFLLMLFFFLHNTIPRLQKSWTRNQPPKGLTMFHKVIRLSIAIIKMKYLVRRWHRIKASGPNSVNRDGFGVSPGVERTDPLHHSIAGLELCPDARQTTHYSSRSDMDVPRSLWPSNRYPGTLVDFDPALKNLSYSSRTLAECWEIMSPRSLHFRDNSELLYNQVHLPPSIILEWEDNCEIILSWGESIYWILNRFLL